MNHEGIASMTIQLDSGEQMHVVRCPNGDFLTARPITQAEAEEIVDIFERYKHDLARSMISVH